MPRRGAPRTIGSEDSLARRVRHERERRGWTPAGLAERMTQAGCPMTQAIVWKLENAKPRRRITVDEAVAFATVFETELADLLVPIELAERAEAVDLYRQALQAADEIQEQRKDLDRLLDRLAELIGSEHVETAINETGRDAWLDLWVHQRRAEAAGSGDRERLLDPRGVIE